MVDNVSIYGILWVANDTFMDQLITSWHHPCAKGPEEKAIFLSDL